MRSALSRWKIAFYLAAIFSTGAISGWMVAAKTVKERMFSPPRPDEIATIWRDRLEAELKLDSEQVRQIESIIQSTSKDIDLLRTQWLKGIRQAISDRNTRIATLLNPEQKQQFETMEKERQEHWRRRDSGRRREFHSRDRRSDHDRPDGSELREQDPTNASPQRSSAE